MYPSRDLADLATRKSILQARIAVRRWECVAAAAQLARPIATIDRGVEMWRKISPFVKFAAVPGGFLFARFLGGRRGSTTAAGKRGKLGTVLAALPLIMRGVRLVGQLRAQHAAKTSGGVRPSASAGSTTKPFGSW